jgi:prevent-host-death family protein
MADVTIRDLRNHGADVVDRVQRGEHVTVTRSGRPVARLVPLPRPAVSARTLLDRWRHLPSLDGDGIRRDLDDVVDARL